MTAARSDVKALLSGVLGDDEARPILREKNLLHAVTQTGFRAGFHLRFFDDLRAMLHSNTNPRAFILIEGMAHAEAAQAATVSFRDRSRSPGQPQRGKNDDEDCGFEGLRDYPITHVHVWLTRCILLDCRKPRQITVVIQ
jgi:hypothetical protein